MDSLATTIDGFADFLLQYAIVLAAAGALAMALVELFKKVNDSRTRFHAYAVSRWFGSPAGGQQALGELLHLAAGVPKPEATSYAEELLQDGMLRGVAWLPIRQQNSAFALELDGMIACFQDSVDLALTAPALYNHLFDFITESADPRDRATWLAAAAAAPGADPPPPQEIKDRAETYGRLRQAAKRKLDSFQMFTAQRWVNKQQFWANILGMLILSAAFVANGAYPGNAAVSTRDLWFAAAFSILGGMLAPIAKDVVVALQQVRQPRPQPPV